MSRFLLTLLALLTGLVAHSVPAQARIGGTAGTAARVALPRQNQECGFWIIRVCSRSCANWSGAPRPVDGIGSTILLAATTILRILRWAPCTSRRNGTRSRCHGLRA